MTNTAMFYIDQIKEAVKKLQPDENTAEINERLSQLEKECAYMKEKMRRLEAGIMLARSEIALGNFRKVESILKKTL